MFQLLVFDEELLSDISEKLKITKQNALRYRNMYYKYNKDLDKLLDKYNRLNQCLDFWEWDKYEENKILDLQKVNRCMDRFCPNCRSVALSQSLTKFAPLNKEMLARGYLPFMITLTIPNVSGEQLEKTIQKMNKAFRKFNQWFNLKDKNYFKGRFFRIAACVKALEVTVQKTNYNMYHPHFHCIAYLDDITDMSIFNKYLEGPYSRNYNNYIKYSEADIQIQKLWKFAYDNIRITNYNNYPDTFYYDESLEQYIYYQCDIREMEMPKGVYEVFKYTFKDSDIYTQNNFETLYFALNGKRLRQGHGELYGLELDCEGETDKEKESIEHYLEKEESPEKLYIREIDKLNKEYHEYKKISRFKAFKALKHLDEL